MAQTAKEMLLPSADHPSVDDEPTAGLAEGSVPAFERLFQRQAERMKSIAGNLLGCVADAEDAVQETFIKIHRGAAGFRGGSRVTTWIYRILVNTCYDQMRASNRRAETPMPARLDLAAPAAGDHPLRLAIEAELRRLPAPERTAFLLCEVEGFSHREAGEILEVPEATSRTFLFRAKRRLQEALRASGAFAPKEAP